MLKTRNSFFVGVLAVICSQVFAGDNDGNFAIGFRKAKWGMTMNQVKRVEKLRLVETEGSLVSEQFDTIYGSECRVVYTFFEKKFHSGGYVCPVSEENVWDLHKFLRGKLVEKYGESPTDAWEMDGKRLDLIGKTYGRDGSVFIRYEIIESVQREREQEAKKEAARKEREAIESAGKL